MPAGAAGLTGALADAAAGAVMLAGGLAVWLRGARASCARLMVLTGTAWFAGELSDRLLYVHRGPLVHLLLAYPAGKVRRGWLAVLVVAAYVDGAVPALARAEWPTIALATALVVAAALRLRAAPAVERRSRRLALAGAAAVGGTLAAAAAARLAGHDEGGAALWAYLAAVVLTGTAFTGDLVWGRWAGSVKELIVDLGDEPRSLRAALARTLGDPGLELGYRRPRTRAWVDETGRPLTLPPADGRPVTFIPASEPVAAVVHDPGVLGEEGLRHSVEAAVRLAVATIGMQDEAADRVRELSASSRRLVEAADDERRLLAEELRAGPERALRALSCRLDELADDREGSARDDLRRLAAELEDARQHLLRFAHGVHPPALGDLAGALEQMAGGAGMDVRLSVTDHRFPAAVEAAGFFVCSEGLANVVKHAAATRVEVEVELDGNTLVARVVDDGRGGAEPTLGSGLRGLEDRVGALGGTLVVHSPSGGGTRLEARMPISPGAAP